jgi:UDP-glucose 4-epimerase
VGDVVAALIRLSDHPDAVGHVFNIGNDEEVTIRELAERVKAMTGSRSPIEFIDFTRACEDASRTSRAGYPICRRSGGSLTTDRPSTSTTSSAG